MTMMTTTMFSQYPAGTTGTFTVKADGTVNIELTIPKPGTIPEESKLPEKRYWVLDAANMTRNDAKRYLEGCRALWAYANDDYTRYYFSARPSVSLMTHRVTETDKYTWRRALEQSGWYHSRFDAPRVINVRDSPVPSRY